MFDTSISRKKYYYNSARRYDWPDPLASEEQYKKFSGLDIENMTDFERWQEIKRLESVIAWLEKDQILFYNAGVHPARIMTRLPWAMERIKKLIGAGRQYDNGLQARRGVTH